MKRSSRSLAVIMLALMLVFAFASCDLFADIGDEVIDGVNDAINDAIGDAIGGSGDTDDGKTDDENNNDDGKKDEDINLGEQEGDTDSSAVKAGDSVTVRMYRGYPADLVALLEIENSENLTWESRCPTVATVDGAGVATSEKCGKTLVTATDSEGKKTLVYIIVEEPVTVNGFAITGGAADETTHHVSSLAEAERLLDEAIASHKSEIIIDFSALGADFDIGSQTLGLEIGNHVKLSTSYYESTPQLRTFIIEYQAATAAGGTTPTDANTYYNLTNGNAVARDFYERADSVKRADDFEDFAINKTNKGEREVYNSEELWWVIEHGYKPAFPIDGTNAERIFELAKTALREIITDDMTEYEKALAIYEYLVEAVAYDYDAFYGNAPAEDRCYYMEGVFDAGRAVCDGKSKAFLMMCRIEGIECVRDRGDAYDGSVGHAWNYIKIDGKWYLVDSTHGDAAHALATGIGAYYGCNVEFVSYGSFLLPLNHHAAEYKYSGMWPEVFAGGMTNDRSDYYYTDKLGDKDIDFTIDSAAEAYGIVEAIVLSGEGDAFVLTFVSPYDANAIYTYFADVEDDFNLDFAIYTTGSGDDLVYIGLFKSLK